MARRGWSLFIMGWLFSPFLVGGQVSPKKIIQNVEKKLTSAKTAKVDFEETYIWELTGEEQSLKGELLLEGKDRFRVTTEDQVIVSDGKTLWTYSKPSHRVLIDRLANSDNALLPRQILFQYTRDYQARVSGEEIVLGKPCHVLTFTSETGDVFITQIKIWVEKIEWIPLKVEQTDLNENQRIFLLHDVQIGVVVDEKNFQFTIPDGAEVIDMR